MDIVSLAHYSVIREETSLAPNAVIQRMKEDSAQMGRVAAEADLVTVYLV